MLFFAKNVKFIISCHTYIIYNKKIELSNNNSLTQEVAYCSF